MVSEPQSSPDSPLDTWLKSLGFIHGNPFATSEADQERVRLHEFFVPVDGYDSIRTHQTIIVFAPRGSGKSALRVMLAHQAAPTKLDAETLVVEITDFDWLLARRTPPDPLPIQDYLTLLLRATAQTLLKALLGHGEASERLAGAQEFDLRCVRAAALKPATRFRLAHLLRRYRADFFSPPPLYEYLGALAPEATLVWQPFLLALKEQRVTEWLTATPLSDHPLAQLVADLCDMPIEVLGELPSPQETLTNLVHLIQQVGFTNLHYLIDRLDEYHLTSNAPEIQAELLAPLLSHLPLLELPALAFKFFLSQEARDILLRHSTIRRDRLTDRSVTIGWDAARLKQLLDSRLLAYSDGAVSDLAQLCAEGSPPLVREGGVLSLGEWIEKELLYVAQHSPRRLLIAAQLLCEAHVDRQGASGVFEAEDWVKAQALLMQRIPPQLVVQRALPRVRVGSQQIKVTKNEHQILLALMDHEGRCTRDELAETVWEAKLKQGVSDETIDAAVNRLRKKLGDDAAHAVYLETLRGEGFLLKHYREEEA